MKTNKLKNTIKYAKFPAIIFVLLVASILLIARAIKLETNDALQIIIAAFEALGLIISLIIAVDQLRDSKKLAKATFIMELNKSFVENPDYMALYDALQNCRDNKCELKTEGCKDGSGCQLNFPKSIVSNYLTFFETVYLLVQDGEISFKVLDDLFAYRFFLGVHHKFLQQEKLQAQPRNFKNIFKLEHEWLKYRKKIGKDADSSIKTVYNSNLLKDMTFPQGITYEDLIN